MEETMSGHSKWSTIRHKKGAKDAAKAKVFTRVQRELFVAAKSGGSDAETNSALRLAIQKAKSVNMPQDTMIRAIKRGAGEIEGETYEEGTYEGYAPCGVGVLVDVMTNNKNRTAADIRHIFSKMGGSLGAPGSVSYNFDRVGQLIFSRGDYSEDDFMEHVLESGAEDLITDDESIFEVVCAPEAYPQVKEYFDNQGIESDESGVVMLPKNKTNVQGEDVYKVMKMIVALEDNDDVQEVFSTIDASDEDMQAAMEKL
jgi:YebC/PmpR family DNA-binding regulatory protein